MYYDKKIIEKQFNITYTKSKNKNKNTSIT